MLLGAGAARACLGTGLILIGVLAPGCGGSGSSKRTTPPASPGTTAAASTNATPVTRAQAIVFAHEVNLHASDVPQMSARTAEGEKASVGPEAIETSRCAGTTSPALRVADVHSPRFASGAGVGAESVKSDVEVKPSAAAAERDAAALRGERAVLCIKRLLAGLAAKAARSGVAKITSVSVSSQPAPLPNPSPSFDIRISFRVSTARAGGISLPLYLDALGFASGPAEVSLAASRAKQPPSGALERRLLSLLYRRASAHGI